jgi:hypothetical protein
MNMARNLSASECRSLAVFFALNGAPSMQMDGETAELIKSKTTAAIVFRDRAARWEEEMQKFAPAPVPILTKCKCKCGCNNLANKLYTCRGCHVMLVCPQCQITSNTCHTCLCGPRDETKQLVVNPNTEVEGLAWYFNDRQVAEKPWRRTTRDTALDPPLARITFLSKVEILEHSARHTRPAGWEKAFRIGCSLQDAWGETADVAMRLDRFMMNPLWAKHDLVQYLKEWLPENLRMRGDVLCQQPKPPPVEKLPELYSPDWLKQSKVEIEEIPDVPEWLAASRAEVRALELALPPSALQEDFSSEFEELNKIDWEETIRRNKRQRLI